MPVQEAEAEAEEFVEAEDEEEEEEVEDEEEEEVEYVDDADVDLDEVRPWCCLLSCPICILMRAVWYTSYRPCTDLHPVLGKVSRLVAEHCLQCSIVKSCLFF